MSKIGYARVSTADQDTAAQVDRLKAEGCGIIREEKASGASREGRTELETILAFLRPGDELMVVRLDRLGRDTRDVLNIVHEVKQKGAYLTVLEPFVTTRGETGEIVLTVLGMVAKMERQFILERQKAGIEKAKKDGVYRGRPVRTELHAQVKALAATGVGATAIARETGCSRGAVYKILNGSQERAL
ncbi:recombinase family protein [Microvirga pudoricolor]|uniref:recombinase family protein n=1 Tax=Microvirga pudoricolor TaxID=2778729 RepID=UPI0019507405|nr:recombinase family protein [Microvirga pudoricolor]MBM6593026.1 recombinase family protein [Microvirga pudoricolor]